MDLVHSQHSADASYHQLLPSVALVVGSGFQAPPGTRKLALQIRLQSSVTEDVKATTWGTEAGTLGLRLPGPEALREEAGSAWEGTEMEEVPT